MFRSFSMPGVAVVFASLLSAGCGSDTATVSGTVTYRGKEIGGGSVVLYCPDRQIVRGLIETDGTYTIPNVPRGGSAVVTVQSPARVPTGLRQPQHLPPFSSGTPKPPAVGLSSGELASANLTVIPPRYALPEESGLSVVVNRRQVAYDIDLKP